MAHMIGVTLPNVDGAWYGRGAEGWTPTADQLAAAEPTVLECIRRSAPGIFARLDEYRCQYMGFVVAGHRRIYYNFFLLEAEIDHNWKTEPVSVLDGGDDYFHMDYDMDSRTCVDFRVNGEA